MCQKHISKGIFFNRSLFHRGRIVQTKGGKREREGSRAGENLTV